jgi:hypothetical protein
MLGMLPNIGRQEPLIQAVGQYAVRNAGHAQAVPDEGTKTHKDTGTACHGMVP